MIRLVSGVAVAFERDRWRGQSARPNDAERALLNSYRWGHLTLDELRAKLGAARADELLKNPKTA